MASHAIPTTPNAGLPQETSDKAELDIGLPRAFFWLGVLTLIYFFNGADRVVVSSMFPAIKAEFKLTDTELGLLGGALGLVIAVLVVPSAALIDKWSRKYMISIMVALWSAATWAGAFAGNYIQLLASRAAVGVGEAGYNPAGYALISAWFPQKMRALAIGIFTAGQPISGVIGLGFAGALAVQFGWRAVLGIFAVPGLLLALLILFAPDYKTKKVEDGSIKAIKPSFWETVHYVLRTRTLMVIYLSQIFIYIWAGAFITWLPSFIGRAYNLNMAVAGQMVMIAFGVAIMGPPIGGWLGDQLFKRRIDGRLVANIILVGIAIVFWTVVFVGASNGAPLVMTVGCWACAQFCTAANFGLPVTAALDLTPAHYRGVSQSFIMLLTQLTTFIAAPLVGLMSDNIGLTNALLITMLTGFGVGLIILIVAATGYETDYKKSKLLGTFVLDHK